MLLQVTLRFHCKQAYKAAGFVTDHRQEQAVVTAVIAAQQVSDSSVELAGSTGQLAYVTSMQDSSVKYKVKAAGTATASCTRARAQMNVIVVFWNFVQLFPHLDLERFVQCIRCGAEAHKDGISKPRRVCGLSGSKLVSAQKYRHPKCPEADGKDVTDSAMDPIIMKWLPWFLAAMFAINLTHSGAMDDDMLLYIHHDVMKGLSFKACDCVLSFLQHNHNQVELVYITYCSYRQQPVYQTKLDCPATSGPPPYCGNFGSAGFCKPYLSSSQWCSDLWLPLQICTLHLNLETSCTVTTPFA